MSTPPDPAATVARIVAAHPGVMRALRAARALALPDWVLAAGAIRSAVWDHLHGFIEPSQPTDLDLAYFDPQLDPGRDARLAARLQAQTPGAEWDVVNQAGVHHWYRARLGLEVPPFPSLEAALAAWPETATAVGVRLHADDRLEVVAPLGLDDLLAQVIRPSPGCLDPDAFAQRLARKRWRQRWPGLRVIPTPPHPDGP